MAEYVGAVVGVGDNESVQILSSPELQVCTELT